MAVTSSNSAGNHFLHLKLTPNKPYLENRKMKPKECKAKSCLLHMNHFIFFLNILSDI